MTQDKLAIARAELTQQGFLKIENLFTAAEIEEVQDIIDFHLAEASAGMEPGSIQKLNTLSRIKACSTLIEFNRTVSVAHELKNTAVYQKAKKAISDLQERHCRYSFDHAIYKYPGSPAGSWHQDQAYKRSVKSMDSMHIWIPLQDVSTTEGGLEYIPLTKNESITLHTRNRETKALEIFPSKERLAQKVSRDIKVGSATVHLPNTIHRSDHNLSDKIRKAWILHFSPYGMAEVLLPHNLIHNISLRVKHALSKSDH